MLPILSARWSLNYSEAGALFTAQYMVSTVAVALSGVLVAVRISVRDQDRALADECGVGLPLAGPKMLGFFALEPMEEGWTGGSSGELVGGGGESGGDAARR